MSAKLTNAYREKILGDVLRDTFKDRMAALNAEENDIALAVYLDAFNKAEIAMLNAAPKGWFAETREIRCIPGGGYQILCLSGESVRFPFKKYQVTLKKYESASPLAERIALWTNAKSDLQKTKDQLSASVRALLDSVTTVKKLLEIWPAVATHAPWLLEEKKPLPAIPVESVLLAIQNAKQAT